MLPEISLNILDIAQNSIRAEADLIEISVLVDREADSLTVIINDDGCGMTAEQVASVEDPFFTTRSTRKIGLGVPFFRMAALITGGTFEITSEVSVGTKVKAVFVLSHIDRMPLGDINSSIHTLITYNTGIDFVYTYGFDGASFTLDTRQMREILGGVPLDSPEVSDYIKEYLDENKKETDGGAQL
ncbi:MAG: ATP-binding protein [Lachnospiraceae bacterium]|nr:ATP-binding protein [Lachnospiraceae bacterium]